MRVHLVYVWRHRRLLSLARPQRFTELIQRRKLIDRNVRIPQLIDKISVKKFVADVLGPDWVTPSLWTGTVLPDRRPFPEAIVVKSRHGCNQLRFLRCGSDDWDDARRAAKGWLQRPYGQWLDEWGYRDVPPGLLIEPFLGSGATLPIDYKLFVFHGRVAAIQVHLDRETDHRWIVFDRSWRRLSSDHGDSDPLPPPALAEMIAGAEELAREFDFVRVDLYSIDDAPRFSEMTFYPGSGLLPLDPPWLDEAFGRLWRLGTTA